MEHVFFFLVKILMISFYEYYYMFLINRGIHLIYFIFFVWTVNLEKITLVQLYSNRNCRLSVAHCNFRSTEIHLSCSWLGWCYCMEFYSEAPWNGRKLYHHGCSIFSSFCWSCKKKPKTVLLFFVSIIRKIIYLIYFVIIKRTGK